MRDNQLTYYPNESQQRHTPIEKISLKGCEILPDVNISSKKYAIRLMIPSIDGMNETLIRCSTVSLIIFSKIFSMKICDISGRTICKMDGSISFSIKRTIDW
jgi:hypothetical protein